MHKIRTYNKISSKGLSRFEAGKYTVTDNVSDPDAFIPVSYTHLRAHET